MYESILHVEQQQLIFFMDQIIPDPHNSRSKEEQKNDAPANKHEIFNYIVVVSFKCSEFLILIITRSIVKWGAYS